MNTAISVKNLGISYRKRLSLRRRKPHTVLSDLTFDLFQGETLGIIGKNGAGKSTLLRILANILKPDYGEVQSNARTVSLLSLNLGLDPNLNGVDNAIMSALLLGFSRKEAEQNLPAIAAFSELGPAIYEPVKTYSSGMNTRLGFSIAIHLQPDVLLIDEVLGVGDVDFRKKSEHALRKKIKSDQTVVLVSHNNAQVKSLCDRVIWIEDGKTMLSGDTDKVIEKYMEYTLKAAKNL